MRHLFDAIAGGMIGCLIWNYFGVWIKDKLHIGERQLGADIKAGVQRAEDKIKSKL